MNIKDVLAKYNILAQFDEMELTDPNQIGIGEDAPIHIACSNGALDDIEIMVSAGADLNLKGDLGHTPLHEAVRSRKPEVVKRVLELGGDAKIKNEFGETPIDLAEMFNLHDIVKILKGESE